MKYVSFFGVLGVALTLVSCDSGGDSVMSDKSFFTKYCAELFSCSEEKAAQYNNDISECATSGRDDFLTGNYLDIDKSKGKSCLDYLATIPCADFLSCQLGVSWSCNKDCYTMMQERLFAKPNIYLYPAEITTISVEIAFPEKGRIVVSDPEYGDGWRVSVAPDGRIDGKYRYLFYESAGTDYFQRKKGWRIGVDELAFFFRADLAEVGFSQAEIDDFVDYWVPILDQCPQYDLYPQTNYDIEKNILVTILPAPDLFIRYYYVIGCSDESKTFETPDAHESINEEGFIAREWGVVPLFPYEMK